MNATVQQELTELFKLVADLCDDVFPDDGRHQMKDIRKEYHRIMQVPEVRAFYGNLVKVRRHENTHHS